MIVDSWGEPLVFIRLPPRKTRSALGDHLVEIATFNKLIFNQAFLRVDDGFESWLAHKSRRNVRKSLRRAWNSGLIAGRINIDDAYEAYYKVDVERGAPVSAPALQLYSEAHAPEEFLSVGVWDNSGNLIATTYGVKTDKLAKVFLSVGSTKNDGARWLCFAEFIRLASAEGVHTFLVEGRRDLSPGLIHFQNMFGFSAGTLILR
jgi:hypothetical protein